MGRLFFKTGTNASPLLPYGIDNERGREGGPNKDPIKWIPLGKEGRREVTLSTATRPGIWA